MTTSNIRWIGEATAVAQVRTTQITGAAAGSTITTRLTAEDGSTQDVVTTMTNSTLADQATVYRDTLAASTQSEFQKLNYTVDGVVVTITARVAGRPFNMSISGTTGSASVSNASPTANAGPNDWNTTANWSGGAVPNANDNVFFTAGSSDVLYGLDQSSAGSYNQMIVGPGYTGSIGTANAPLKVNIDGGGEKSLVLGGSGRYHNIEGDIENLFVEKLIGTAKVGNKFKKVVVSGPSVVGKLILNPAQTDSGGHDLFITGIQYSAVVEVPSTGLYVGNIYMDSGVLELNASTRDKSRAIIGGTGCLKVKGSGRVDGSGTISTGSSAAGVTHHEPATITVIGLGKYVHESDQDLASGQTHLALLGGEADFERVKSRDGAELIDLGVCKVLGGTLKAGGSASLVDLTAVENVKGSVELPSNTRLAGFTKISG